ncbi:hypothetical protein CHH28_07190 [Bacterioplanes sanyensis]|uniref:Mannan-binding protein domain-containing protein n=1 Tax=Bacterioplanes sanyensis TaxID=1249553 RepID=A0A222FI80_9GAMM|nr:mannan-binding lectin [Bacterioplanes sanyensis]ASP38469.1 hypothetical protein CHH28_07190 [Bacterioplanes sanyensis]
MNMYVLKKNCKTSLLLALAAVLVLVGTRTVYASSLPAKPSMSLGNIKSECITQHPSGTMVVRSENGAKITHPDGSTFDVADKTDCQKVAMEKSKEPLATTQCPPLHWEYLNAQTWFPPAVVGSFTANYTVPPTPDIVGEQSLFYWIGLDSDYGVIQPVLAFSDGGWKFASFIVANNNIHMSSYIDVKPNDVIQAAIKKVPGENSQYQITASSSGQSSNLNVDIQGHAMPWAMNVLESWFLQSCNELSEGPMLFSNIEMKDVAGQVLSPQWTPFTTLVNKNLCKSTMTVNNNGIAVTKPAYIGLEAGPIWDNSDARNKCPSTCGRACLQWSGQWRTTEPGKQSVCGCN